MAKFIVCKFCNMKYWERQPGNPCSYCGATQYTERTKVMTKKASVAGQNGDSWEVKIDTIHDCSKAPTDIVVKIDLIAKLKIDSLMEKYPNIEWLAYLIGKPEEDLPADEEGKVEVIPADPLHVVEIHIPEQEVTAARVDNIECDEFNDLNIVGVIHSHHGMGTGFSGTDHEFINGNHNLSLVIAKNGVAGQYRWSTPCGALKIIDTVKVKVVYPKIGFDKDAWLEEETKKIKKPVVTTSYHYPQTYGQGGYLNPSQQRYNTGVSVKAAVAAEDDDTWETNSDDAPDYDMYQPLEDALNEAFEE